MEPIDKEHKNKQFQIEVVTMDFFKSMLGGGANNIDPVEANTKLQAKPAPILLDVREKEEFREIHIPGAKLIPLGELANRMKELPKDREILVICASGSRSSLATRQLVGMGYQAFNIRGGMMNWHRAGLPVKR